MRLSIQTGRLSLYIWPGVPVCRPHKHRLGAISQTYRLSSSSPSLTSRRPLTGGPGAPHPHIKSERLYSLSHTYRLGASIPPADAGGAASRRWTLPPRHITNTSHHITYTSQWRHTSAVTARQVSCAARCRPPADAGKPASGRRPIRASSSGSLASALGLAGRTSTRSPAAERERRRRQEQTGGIRLHYPALLHTLSQFRPSVLNRASHATHHLTITENKTNAEIRKMKPK